MLKGELLPGSKATWVALTHQGGGARFQKEVLYEGLFLHPSTGRKHAFNRSYLTELADNSNRLGDSGISIPFPDGHKFNARSNIGFWSKFEVKESESAPGKSGLFAVVDVPNPEDASKVGKTITEVSVLIEPAVSLTNGDKIAGPTCTHVCATNYPVIPKQGNFVATLSREGDDVEMDIVALERQDSSNGDSDMQMKHLVASVLGLTDGASDESVKTELTAKLGMIGQLQSDNEDLKRQLVEDVNAALSKSPSDKALTKSEREIALEVQLLSLTQDRSNALLKSALDSAKITKVEHDIFSKLIAVGETQVIPLGRTDAESIDAFDLIGQLIESRDPNSAFSAEPTSRKGVTTELETEKKYQAAQALDFQSRGYNVVWDNEEHTKFHVER